MDEPYYILGDITHTEPVPIDQALTFRPARRFVPIPITEISRPLKRRQKMVEGANAHLETENTQPKGMVDQLALAKANYWAMKHAQDLKNQKALDQKALVKHKAATEAAAVAAKKLNKPMSEADREDDDDTSEPTNPAEDAADAVAQEQKPPNPDADNPANQAGENAAAALEATIRYDQLKNSLTNPSGADIKQLYQLATEEGKIDDFVDWLLTLTYRLVVEPVNLLSTDADKQNMATENMRYLKTMQSLPGLPQEVYDGLQEQEQELDTFIRKDPVTALPSSQNPTSVGDLANGVPPPPPPPPVPLNPNIGSPVATTTSTTTQAPPIAATGTAPTVDGSVPPTTDTDAQSWVDNNVGAAGNREELNEEGNPEEPVTFNRNSNKTETLLGLNTDDHKAKWAAMLKNIDKAAAQHPSWKSQNFENDIRKYFKDGRTSDSKRNSRRALIQNYNVDEPWETTRQAFLDTGMKEVEGWGKIMKMYF